MIASACTPICPAVMADKGMLAAREATPEPAAHGASSGGESAAPTMLGEQGSAQLGSGRLEGQEGAGGVPGYRVSDSVDAELAARTAAGDEEYDPETAFGDEGGPPDDGAPTAGGGKLAAPVAAPTAAALDWASIKAAAASAAAEQQQQSQLGGGGATAPLGSLKLQEQLSGELKGRQGGKHHHHHHHKRDPISSSPRELPSPHEVRVPGHDRTR